MTPRRRTAAILGAGGYIGQHFARLLADHPWFEPPQLLAGERSAGRRLEDVWVLPEPPPPELATVRLRSFTPAGLARQGVEVAFSALPSGVAGPTETSLARRGVAVFSNAADHRLDPDVPLLVPEVNADHLALLDRRPRGRAPLVTNANCSATGLAVALAGLRGVVPVREVHVATYQALSGAGYPGVASLAITDNVVPFIAQEEEKLAAETPRILGRLRRGRVEPSAMEVVAHCVRVGVREGHLEAVTLRVSRPVAVERVARALRAFDPLASDDLPSAPHPPLVVRTESDRPQPLRDRWAGSPTRARGMAVTVGRVRADGPHLRFLVLSHNAVRGGAGGSVLNAELALARGYLGRPEA